MILTCPNCATRYQVDAQAFAASGRQVRCAKCEYSWFQPAIAPEFEPQAAPPRRHYDSEEDTGREIVEEAPEPAETNPAFVASDRARRRRRRTGALIAWLVLIVIVGGLGAASYLYRYEIVAAWPQAGTLYDMIGVDAQGLKFNKVIWTQELEDGNPVLVISGEIVNMTSNKLEVPKVRVSLRDGQRRDIYHWTFAPDVAQLAPGQAAPFMTRLSRPPAEAVDFEVRMARAGE